MPKQSTDSLTEKLDRYICGERGAYYWQIERPNGQQFGGGMFYRISDARKHMISRLIALAEGRIK